MRCRGRVRAAATSCSEAASSTVTTFSDVVRVGGWGRRRRAHEGIPADPSSKRYPQRWMSAVVEPCDDLPRLRVVPVFERTAGGACPVPVRDVDPVRREADAVKDGPQVGFEVLETPDDVRLDTPEDLGLWCEVDVGCIQVGAGQRPDERAEVRGRGADLVGAEPSEVSDAPVPREESMGVPPSVICELVQPGGCEAAPWVPNDRERRRTVTEELAQVRGAPPSRYRSSGGRGRATSGGGGPNASRSSRRGTRRSRGAAE